MITQGPVIRRDLCLTYCFAVAIVNFLIVFGQGTPHFHPALGPAKHLASLGRDGQETGRNTKGSKSDGVIQVQRAPGEPQEGLSWPEGPLGKLQSGESSCGGVSLVGETGSGKGRFAKESYEARMIRFMLSGCRETTYNTKARS